MKKLLIISMLAILASCSGKDGLNGSVGPKGADGSSCSVTQTINGLIISCTDGTSAVLLNGKDGEDAPSTPYSITEIINPCGDSPGFDEILFRTHSNQIIAHFSSGGLQFLTILSPGSYRTTDSESCLFSINSNMEVIW